MRLSQLPLILKKHSPFSFSIGETCAYGTSPLASLTPWKPFVPYHLPLQITPYESRSRRMNYSVNCNFSRQLFPHGFGIRNPHARAPLFQVAITLAIVAARRICAGAVCSCDLPVLAFVNTGAIETRQRTLIRTQHRLPHSSQGLAEHLNLRCANGALVQQPCSNPSK
jgi:hypothetical protein